MLTPVNGGDVRNGKRLSFASRFGNRLAFGSGFVPQTYAQHERFDQGGEIGARPGTRWMGSDYWPWGEGSQTGAKASTMIQWIWRLIPWRSDTPQADRRAFERREAELRDRHERLERLAVEADVISRSDTSEDQAWIDR